MIIRLLIILALLVVAGLYYFQHEAVIVNRIDEYGRAGKTLVDEQWEFKHCTSNSTTNCGRLK